MKKNLTKIDNPNDDFIQALLQDERKGVQVLLQKWLRHQENQKLQHEKFLDMMVYERKFSKEGYRYIAGIDEVGRGPLAGPVVAAAVILPSDIYLPGIDDSKKLTESKREQYYAEIKEKAIAIGIGIIDNDEIDAVNILNATKKAMLQALQQLTPQARLSVN